MNDTEIKRIATALALNSAGSVEYWVNLIRPALTKLADGSTPEWATPEAKAVLDAVRQLIPVLNYSMHSNILERIQRLQAWLDLAGAHRAYLASIKPKTVQLPEAYSVEDAAGNVFYRTLCREDAEGELAKHFSGCYLRILPSETVEAKS